jgi:hypothetical protein
MMINLPANVPSGIKFSRLKKTLTYIDEFDSCKLSKACDNLQLDSTSCKPQQALAISARIAPDECVRVNVASHSCSPGFFCLCRDTLFGDPG